MHFSLLQIMEAKTVELWLVKDADLTLATIPKTSKKMLKDVFLVSVLGSEFRKYV